MADAALFAHPARLRAANWLRTFAALGVLIGTVAFLTLVFGRTGERIAVLMCVNVSAVVALAVFCGNTGIVSFGHGAFMALGAYLSGILTMPAGLQRSALPELPGWLAGHELSVLGALPFVLLAGAGFALLTGSAISRLVGASAAIATLGLLIIVHSIAVSAREFTRGSQTFYGVPRITDLTFVLMAAIVFVILARVYRESRWGLFVRAVRDDEDAATALGIAPRRARLAAWTLSGTLAVVAGALYGHILGAFSPASFYLGLVFAHVVMMIVGGMSSVGGAVVGVIAVTILQNTVRNLEGGITLGGVTLPEVFGLTTVSLGVAILLVIWFRPQGLVGGFELGPGAGAGLLRRIASRATEPPAPRPVSTETLKARGLSRAFAGVKAVTDVSFDVPAGRITGLIGPNGAGKSTLVNLITCQYDADTGSAEIEGVDLTGLPRHRIIDHRVARSFQNLRLFSGLTAFENVLVAALAAGNSRQRANAIALRELEAFDLGSIAAIRADNLPYGARKRLEIARALAQDPAILLLDEPAAGMNPAETDDLADRLIRIREDRRIGILLIDHDLRFVNRLCSHIVVMNRGEKIAEGTPEEVRGNPQVIEAYIGRGRVARAADAQTPQDQALAN
ncbi:ABC transporter permease subunit [Marivita hallyeonensis]|uniref:Amino acid/amide ABC transporter membrane protein 2, HAAT family /amino acid/amide ABC transporter ATP-binding protein 1, HAAT family n=1 Tax=Marivita hallyeonensis TaxID=996342 RepID=A0A1M5X2B8_9RHOB|nr:branched-chain amino acid ABC transporter ATP-binding protein/permease [Marivita hallyeonensis]SHH93890.1 amino acid/amide ABC transporter membrane protein 2, HAAT family /amino acid/amide ABC transporter ATP-binding protein 1, HAAT family [Marivita hallyeonensis]